MIDQQQIQAGMAVVDSNGVTIGTVQGLGDDGVLLSSADFTDGLQHYVPMTAVQSIEAGKLIVTPGEATTIEAIAGAADYSRAHTPSHGGGALFGTSGRGTGMGGSGIGD